MIRELLDIAYKRELELEELLETTISYNKWFFEETKQLNVDIQNACLDKLEWNTKMKERERRLNLQQELLR